MTFPIRRIREIVAGNVGTVFVRGLLLLLLALPAVVHSQDYTYTTNNGTITITRYFGPGGVVTVPGTITGLPVTSIGEWAFLGVTNLTDVTISDG